MLCFSKLILNDKQMTAEMTIVNKPRFYLPFYLFFFLIESLRDFLKENCTQYSNMAQSLFLTQNAFSMIEKEIDNLSFHSHSLDQY